MPTTEETAEKLVTNFLRIPLSHLRRNPRLRRSTVKEDIVVILDGSGSIGNCEFDKAKQALKNVLDLASEAGFDDQFAAVSFSNSAVANFNFEANPKAGENIKQIPYLNQGTNTQAGLQEAKRLFEDPASGTYMRRWVSGCGSRYSKHVSKVRGYRPAYVKFVLPHYYRILLLKT